MWIKLDLSLLQTFVAPEELNTLSPKISKAVETLVLGSGQGKEFLGWLNAPLVEMDLQPILQEAQRLREISDVVVVLGVGGSYLGAKAGIDFVKSPLYNDLGDTPKIYFAGNNLSPSYLREVLGICKGKRTSILVVSKSGSTVETAIAFRVFESFMKEVYGEQRKERITVIADGEAGSLRKHALLEGYRQFVIPGDIGGRYSVLTPVGLLPLAVAGVDIVSLMAGAKQGAEQFMKMDYREEQIFREELMAYIGYRHLFHEKGYTVALLSGWDPSLTSFIGWLQQLFGESEGKEGKGLLPVGIHYSADLHSLGQYVQEGKRNLFETVFCMERDKTDLVIPKGKEHEPLAFLDERSLEEVRELAVKGVNQAHLSGGVPVATVTLKDRSAETLGYGFYYWMFACGVSSYLLAINPFDQPGVEAYKQNMKTLLEQREQVKNIEGKTQYVE